MQCNINASQFFGHLHDHKSSLRRNEWRRQTGQARLSMTTPIDRRDTNRVTIRNLRTDEHDYYRWSNSHEICSKKCSEASLCWRSSQFSVPAIDPEHERRVASCSCRALFSISSTNLDLVRLSRVTLIAIERSFFCEVKPRLIQVPSE